MIILSINFNSFLSQVIAPKQASNPENMQLSVIGRFYKKLFAWLAEEIERIAQAESSDELKAEKIKLGLFQISDNKGNKFTVQPQSNYCSCYQINCHHIQLAKSLMPNLSQAIAGGKSKIKSPALKKLAVRELGRAWELVEF